ncbi:MAG: endonuclease/exonuclease/phosphatase family protein [Planctomycetota bacterium]
MFRNLLLFGLFLIGTALGVAAEPLRVVTYNIRYANPNDGPDYWPKRADAVAKFLADFDVIGLQEVTKPQFDQLRSKLKAFDSYGLGRDDGKSGGEHAAIFFRPDRVKVVDKGTIWLSETPDKIGVKGWDAALPRTCTWMVFQLNNSDKKLFVANTHFDHRGANARTQSGKLLRTFTQQRSDGLPAIVMGDFNCMDGSAPYVALTDPKATGRSPLKDARTVSLKKPGGPNSTWCGFKEIAPDRIIDHIFVMGALTVRQVDVLDPRTSTGRFASDHLPVAATIELGQSD